MQTFRICDIVPPMSFKSSLSVYILIQNAKMSYQCVIEHLPHSSASNFQSKKTQPGDLPEERHVRGAPTSFHCPGSDSSPRTTTQRWMVTLGCSIHSHILPQHSNCSSHPPVQWHVTEYQYLHTPDTPLAFTNLFVTTSPKLSRTMPELPVLCIMNLVLCSLANDLELPQTILIRH